MDDLGPSPMQLPSTVAVVTTACVLHPVMGDTEASSK